ncbi:S1 family peptidase [Lentzea sp. HUAS12]|uniref:S1 family peptidase n=1 Tax=Lentzea sp. HUAS12 TaxID=2951806 RepID=UPI00209FD746|nr:S1 family peptidase [Lentzea sp. HUAS12]USX56325.1 S1 family peptidase [Lentzea sp. HUAS12]
MSRKGIQPKWRAVLAALAVVGSASVVPGVTMAAPPIEAQAKLAASQFHQVDLLSEELSALGTFRDGVRNVVMMPAEKADSIGIVRSRINAQLTGALIDVRASQFTTDRIKFLGSQTGPRESSGIPVEYGYTTLYVAEKDRYVIQTDAPSSLLEPLLKKYPGELATEWGETVAEHRYNDTFPFNGATSVVTNAGICTVGAAVRDRSGSSFMTIAGHCVGAVGEKVYVTDTKRFIGTVAYINRRLDIALLSGSNSSYNMRIWTGGYRESESSLLVGGGSYTYRGMRNLYTSGQTTYNQGNHYVTDSGTNHCLSGQNTCILDNRGFMYDGGRHTTSGDSGAPVYYINGDGKVVVVGSHSGHTTDANGVRKMFGVQMGYVLSAYTLSMYADS